MKRRVVIVALVAFAVWPLVHRVLVLRYDLSPWRFFGWAMYCQPKIPLVVDAWVRVDGTRVPLEQALGESAELSRRRFEFIERRETWGALAQPDELGTRILEAVPHAESAEIVVRRLGLNPSTARISARRHEYHLYRGDP